MTKVAIPEPFDSVYDETDKVMVGCYSAIQMEAYAAAKVREALELAESAVTTLYEANYPPLLIEICREIRALIPQHDNE